MYVSNILQCVIVSRFVAESLQMSGAGSPLYNRDQNSVPRGRQVMG